MVQSYSRRKDDIEASKTSFSSKRVDEKKYHIFGALGWPLKS